MKGLLLKDIYGSKPIFKSLIFSLILFSVLGFFTGNIMYVTMMLSILSLSIVSSGMALDEQSGWNEYVLSLPVTRKDLVVEKYIFSLGLVLIFSILSLLISFLSLKLNGEMNFEEVFYVNIGTFLAICFLITILLPILFKYGVEKARIAMVVIGMLPFALFTFFLRFEIDTSFLKANLNTIAKLIPLILLIFILLSYKLSLRIVERKDF